MAEKAEHSDNASQTHDKPGPAGGYDDSPVPAHVGGYTIKITFHSATHLPIADLGTMSSDPYLKAEFQTALPSRHKEDPAMAFRSRTAWRTTEPRWNQDWIIHHVPASGFRLKIRVFDEDASDKDDRLGNAHVDCRELNEAWEGIYNRDFKIHKSAGSWRAYALKAVTLCMGRDKHMHGLIQVSVRCLGQSPGMDGGRAYTVGPNNWCKNFSPILGRITGTQNPGHHKNQGEDPGRRPDQEKESDTAPGLRQRVGRGEKGGRGRTSRYNFQSNQMQLQGPVPAELYHRYVEFRPFMKSMFTGKGLRGMVLSKALHHQHTVVYNYNRDTEYGTFSEPSNEMTLKFLELAHWDKGGRIHTYVITLDGLLRFTETGKEFGIDLLSKHTMHSDVGVYIAFSGEFFIRGVRHKNKDASESIHAAANDVGASAKENESHPPHHSQGGLPDQESPRDPGYYELVIDNDSGTYRPNAALLPVLRKFLMKNFPGLKILTLDCQKDEEQMKKLKQQQRDLKKAEAGGEEIIYTQVSRSSSASSSDDERLDELQAEREREGHGHPPKHKLGEAVGPLIGDHDVARKAVAG